MLCLKLLNLPLVVNAEGEEELFSYDRDNQHHALVHAFPEERLIDLFVGGKH